MSLGYGVTPSVRQGSCQGDRELFNGLVKPIQSYRLGLKTQPKSKLGLKPTFFSSKSHTWSQDLMKLRFFMSQHRKNSVRDKVIDEKWTCLERDTFHRQDVVHLKK